MPDDLLIARNPEPDSTLPFLVRIPLGPRGIVVKAKQTWPREKKIYCHRAEGWPDDAEIVERLEVRSCTRRGPAIDLVLARARENRSQFVIAQARGREMIFWQSPRTTKQARPAVRIPTARAHGQVLEIVVDTAEKYPYTFNGQQATTSGGGCPPVTMRCCSTTRWSRRSSGRPSRICRRACCPASSPTRSPS